MSNVVWKTKLDKKYQCEVVRIDGYKGLLTVVDEETDELVLKEEVGLSYGAQFGPDMGDVALWQEKIINAVDNP